MSSDAQESKGDAPGQLPAKNRGRADKLRSSGGPYESIETAVDVSQQDLAACFGRTRLDGKKPSTRGKTAGIQSSNLAQIGTHLAAQAVPDYRSSDFAGHCERDARRLVAGQW